MESLTLLEMPRWHCLRRIYRAVAVEDARILCMFGDNYYFIVKVTGDGRMDLWNGRVEDPNAAATALS